MTGAVLTHLGDTRLELGPAGDAAAAGPWRAATDAEGVMWLLLDVPGTGTNTVSQEVLQGLSDQLDRIAEQKPRGLVIRSAKTGGFAAGADIAMFARMANPDASQKMLRSGHDVLDRLEALDIPTICVVHGAALGAGFEIALACDRIIAVDGASFGFPEVNLGLHPGLGGTFRLPARIDTIEAMTLMLTGKTAHTSRAKHLGIADEVTQERHVYAAVHAMMQRKADRTRSLTSRAMALSTARALAAKRMRAQVDERAPKDHYPAPHALIALWEEHGGDRHEMQKREIMSFSYLLATETSKNLQRVFFLRQKLKEGARGEDGIAHVHVVGAGAMGAAIAAWAALKGKQVTVSDPDQAALGRAVAAAGRICKDAHLTDIETRDALDRMMPDPLGYGAGRADLVIEAGPEDAAIKAGIYAELEPRMKAGAILATNTSSLGLAELASGLKRPEAFAGLHFFNPVNKMQLIEVVRHDGTDAATAGRLSAFCGVLDRLPVEVADSPGFLVNRALTPYLLEAILMIDEGFAKERIDRAAEAFGMPVGPVELADQVGLDICLDVADALRASLQKPMAEVPEWLREKVETHGETGRKSGKGLYDWSDGKPQKSGDDDEGDDAELIDRLILPMLDACVECLRRGVAPGEGRLDGAMIFGTGFAPFRGGPLHYARARGIAEIRSRLDDLARLHGDRFRADPGWADLR